ncbi:MAG: NnrU family protein [Rhodobacteraceae bacterium]|nr:MAG: NnrU family protein [Paracoccaceae bacterium]
MGWIEFIAAFAAFFLTHAIPVRPPVKPWLVARLGARGFIVAYSLLSLGVLIWLLRAAGRAPYLPLWDWAEWQVTAAMTLMLPACLILALALGRPNPFSFGGPAAGFDPARPGMVRVIRHPLLIVLALWAGAHTLANGDLAHVLVFGSFALFALLGGSILDRRRQREMGAEWHRLWQKTRSASARPLSRRLFDPAMSRGQMALRLGAGLLLYGALLGLHPYVIGVAILG